MSLSSDVGLDVLNPTRPPLTYLFHNRALKQWLDSLQAVRGDHVPPHPTPPPPPPPPPGRRSSPVSQSSSEIVA